ncbi:bifunctional glyoxylate/hydroxypyruvate reductase B, partial [Acinetobacter sp. 207]
MRKKVVVFSQIDAEILSKLEQDYQVVQVSPKLGDVNQQLLEHVQDADGMIGAGRLLNQ